jgi:hypothetical protein
MMFLAMTVPAVVYGGLAVTIPESPRYLVSRMRPPQHVLRPCCWPALPEWP